MLIERIVSQNASLWTTEQAFYIILVMTFYAVGIGPGNPELLTLEAVRTIEKCPVIFCPKTKSGATVALSIIKEARINLNRKTIIECEMPMNRDSALLAQNYEKIALQCAQYLSKGLDTAFITLGDVSFYSTAERVSKIVAEKGFDVVWCAGVTSISASAARIAIPLAERDEEITIIPADSAFKNGTLKEALARKGTKVLMKLSRSYQDVIKILFETGLSKTSTLFQNCGLEGERILSLGNYTAESKELFESESYFSLVIVK